MESIRRHDCPRQHRRRPRPSRLDSNDAAIGWGIDRVNYPMQEGTFFGDILDTGALANIGKP